MKFKINRDFFSAGLQLVTSVVGTRKTPILQNVLIEVDRSRSTYYDQSGFRYSLFGKAEVSEKGQ